MSEYYIKYSIFSVYLYTFLTYLQHHWEASASVSIFTAYLMSCFACVPWQWGAVTWFSNPLSLCINSSAALLVIKSSTTISTLWVSDMLFTLSVYIDDLFTCNNSPIISAAVNSNCAFTACSSTCNCACMFTSTTSHLKRSQQVNHSCSCCWQLRLMMSAGQSCIHILSGLAIYKSESIAEFSDTCMLLHV